MVKKRCELWVLLFTGVVVHMLTSTNLNMAITAMVKQNVSRDNTVVSECQVSINLTTNSKKDASLQVMGEFDWSNNERDALLSSFAWLMGTASLIGGILCQRLGGKIMFGYSNLVAGMLNFAVPTAANFGVIWVIVIRVMQGFAGGAGVGNAINYFMSKWVPRNERSKFAATMAGLYFGVGISNLLNGFILYLLGWRYVFYVSGIITIIWSLVWYYNVYNNPEKHPRVTKNELATINSSIGNELSKKRLPIPWIRIITSVPIIVNTMCYFSNMWTTFTFISYVPTYLRTIHGLSYDKLGSYASLPYLLEFLVAISFATLTDFMIKRKILSVTNTRKFAAFTINVKWFLGIDTFGKMQSYFAFVFSADHIIGTALFGCLVFGGCNLTFILIMFTIAVTVNGTSVAIYTPNIIDLSPNFSAAIHGLQGLISSTAGFISPMVVNYFTNNYKGVDGWNRIFIVSMVLNIVSGSLFLIFGVSKVQSWNSECKKDGKVEHELQELEKDEKF